MPLLFSIIEQDLAQRFCSTNLKRSAMLSAFAAGILLLLFAFVPFYFGVQHTSQMYYTTDVNLYYPFYGHIPLHFFYALAVCALLSAITSTTDSLLCAISAITTQSFTTHYKITATVKLSCIITLIYCTRRIDYFISCSSFYYFTFNQ